MAGVPRTIDVGIDGPAQTQTFVLPQTVSFDLEAVYVEIDASGAGGPVTAELILAEQNGVVIAKKRQSETVDAGGVGTATWALRLDDEGGGTPAGSVVKAGVYFAGYATIPAGGDALLSWTLVSGDAVLDLTVPTSPKRTLIGEYACTANFNVGPADMSPAATYYGEFLWIGATLPFSNGSSPPADATQSPDRLKPRISLSLSPCVPAASDTLAAAVVNNDPALANDFGCTIFVEYRAL